MSSHHTVELHVCLLVHMVLWHGLSVTGFASCSMFVVLYEHILSGTQGTTLQ